MKSLKSCLGVVLILGIASIAIVALLSLPDVSPNRPPQSAVSPPRGVVIQAASDELQQERASVIKRLQSQRILQKITDDTPPRIYILPAFRLATFDQKQSFINVCHAWCYRLQDPVPPNFVSRVVIHDAMTNKVVGEYRLPGGLVLR